MVTILTCKGIRKISGVWKSGRLWYLALLNIWKHIPGLHLPALEGKRKWKESEQKKKTGHMQWGEKREKRNILWWHAMRHRGEENNWRGEDVSCRWTEGYMLHQGGQTFCSFYIPACWSFLYNVFYKKKKNNVFGLTWFWRQSRLLLQIQKSNIGHRRGFAQSSI